MTATIAVDARIHRDSDRKFAANFVKF